MKYTVFSTPFGWIGLAGTSAGIRRITLPCPEQEAAESEITSGLRHAERDDVAFAGLRDQLERYFRGEPVEFDCPLDETGLSDFLRRIYACCRAIPRGQVITYTQLAEGAGSARAARAAGRAMATNPWPIVVPCHRVVGSDGTLRGYGGGLPMKEALINLERISAKT